MKRQTVVERYSRQKKLNMQRLQGWKKDDTFQEQYSKTSSSNGSKSEGPMESDRGPTIPC